MADWTPALISTAIWLDAADASTITEITGDVSDWVSKSSGANNFTQATGSLQPVTNSTSQNGLNTISFAGDYLTSDEAASVWAFLSDGTEHQIYVVAKSGVVASPNAIYGILGTNARSSVKIGQYLAFDDRATFSQNDALFQFISKGSNPPVISHDSGNGFAASNVYTLNTVQTDPGNGTTADRSEMRAAGDTAVKNNTGTATPSGSSPAHTLDIAATGNGSSPLTGEIAEIVVTTGAEDADERQVIEGYLAHRWGLEGDLPGGHPYKASAPQALPAITSPGPLQNPDIDANVDAVGFVSAPGPLQNPELWVNDAVGLVSAASMLGAPAVVGSQTAALISVPGPLEDPTVDGWMNIAPFTSGPDAYVADLDTPGGVVRVKIKSWQATLQLTDANYIQCVIPAVADFVADIIAATAVTISRVTEVQGSPFEYVMARLSSGILAQFTQGARNYTCVLSGYSPGYVDNGAPAVEFDRVLDGVRSLATGPSGLRVRCKVDFMLRPGHRAFVDGTPFIASYINFYVLAQDAYMDVGERI